MQADFDRHLWDGSGEDAELARLEAALRPLRHRPHPLPARCYPNARPARRWPRALAAAIVLLLIALPMFHVWRLAWPSGEAWPGRIVRADGATTEAQLVPGTDFTAPADARAEFSVARIGRLQLAPGSTLRLVESRSGRHRAELVEGTLAARVWAPPGAFGVAVGDVEAVDLGCAFTLTRGADGGGALQVDSGWVQLAGRRDSVVPAGARAEIDPLRGPGTPYRQDAPAALREALTRIDAADGAVAVDGAEISAVLAAGNDADAISYVSLLSRYPALAGGPLLARASAALPHAGAVDARRVLAGDAQALNPLWDALPYPRSKRWWLHWPDALGAPGSPTTGGSD